MIFSILHAFLCNVISKTATRQRRAFSIVGPYTWNGLPLEIRILPKNNESVFAGCLRLICIAVAGLGRL